MRVFSRGQISAQEFEDVAFSLEHVGDVSEPFKTAFGWHIILLKDKKLVPDYETMKPELIAKVKKDSRSKLIDQALVDNLKMEYGITDNQEALDYFESILNDTYFRNAWKLPANFTANNVFLSIGKKQLLYSDFGAFLLKTERQSRQKKAINTLVDEKYQAFLKTNLIAYKEANLEFENEEYASVITEYRDGLLLFELMETTIWNVAETDSIAVKAYYDAHKTNYVFPVRIDAVIASSANKKTLKTVSKLLIENNDIEEIKSIVNTNDTIDVIFTTGIMDANHQGLPDNFEFEKGVSKIFKHNDAYVVIDVKDVIAETQKTFEEAKGAVVSDYQLIKEEQWIEELGNKYEISINEEVFKKVKEQLK